jgi:hypothetical protein
VTELSKGQWSCSVKQPFCCDNSQLENTAADFDKIVCWGSGIPCTDLCNILSVLRPPAICYPHLNPPDIEFRCCKRLHALRQSSTSFTLIYCFGYSSTLKMEAMFSSETFVSQEVRYLKLWSSFILNEVNFLNSMQKALIKSCWTTATYICLDPLQSPLYLIP